MCDELPLSHTRLTQWTCLTIPVLKRLLSLGLARMASSRTPPSPSKFVTGQAPTAAHHKLKKMEWNGQSQAVAHLRFQIPSRPGDCPGEARLHPAECFSSVSALIGNARCVWGKWCTVSLCWRVGCRAIDTNKSRGTGGGRCCRRSSKVTEPCNPCHKALTQFGARLLRILPPSFTEAHPFHSTLAFSWRTTLLFQ
jgi:hypothetical protein